MGLKDIIGITILHKCKYENKLYDIPMENNTNFLITQCRCGKTNMVRAHRESKMYKEWSASSKNKENVL